MLTPLRFIAVQFSVAVLATRRYRIDRFVTCADIGRPEVSACEFSRRRTVTFRYRAMQYPKGGMPVAEGPCIYGWNLPPNEVMDAFPGVARAPYR